SSHIWDVAEQVKKTQDSTRSMRKTSEQLLEEIADLQAKQILSETSEVNGCKSIVRILTDRNVGFVKLLAQRLTRLDNRTLALLAGTSDPPGIVFAQAPGQPFDMGALMKATMARLGGRGGGNKDLAQGSLPQAKGIEAVLKEIANQLIS